MSGKKIDLKKTLRSAKGNDVLSNVDETILKLNKVRPRTKINPGNIGISAKLTSENAEKLDELKYKLRKNKITKNEVINKAISFIYDDFKKNGEGSFLLTK